MGKAVKVWLLIVRVSLVGFLMNCQPSEPYLTRYMVEEKGVSRHTVNNIIYNVNTVAYLLLMLPIGILSEKFPRCSLFFLFLFRIFTRLILLFGHGVVWMSAAQVTYSFAMALHVGYLAYAFRVVPPGAEGYLSFALTFAYYAGNSLGAAIAQISVHFWSSVNNHLVILFYFSLFFTLSSGIPLLTFPRAPPAKKAHPNSLSLSNPFVVCLLAWTAFTAAATTSITPNYYQSVLLAIDHHFKGFGWVQIVMEVASMSGSLISIPFHYFHPPLTILLSTLALSACLGAFAYIGQLFFTSIWIFVACLFFAKVPFILSETLVNALLATIALKSSLSLSFLLASYQFFSQVLSLTVTLSLAFTNAPASTFVAGGGFLELLSLIWVALGALCLYLLPRSYLHLPENTPEPTSQHTSIQTDL